VETISFVFISKLPQNISSRWQHQLARIVILSVQYLSINVAVFPEVFKLPMSNIFDEVHI
jgi:hypothetical protein